MKHTKLLSMALIGLALASCNSKQFYDQTYAQDNKLTLGTVQKEIQKGMAQDQVVIALGSPNMVTKDKDDKETWVYDKIATEVRASGTEGIMLFFQTGADYVHRQDTSQKTLTVVIKFDENRRVDAFSYHSSKF